MQVLLLAQPVQERSLLLQQSLPRREEHGAADVQPDPLPIVPAGRVDDRAVTQALRRRPACFSGAGRGGRRALSRLAVFVVVVIVVVAVVVLAAVVRRRRRHVRRFPLLARCRCHLGKAAGDEVKTTERIRLSPRCLLFFPLRYGTEHAPPPTRTNGARAACCCGNHA